MRQHLWDTWNQEGAPRMQPGAQTMHAHAGGSVLWGLFGGRLHFITRNAQVNNVPSQVYRFYNRQCIIICFDGNIGQSTIVMTNPYDVVPGGYQSTWSMLSDMEFDYDTRDGIVGYFAWIWFSASGSAGLEVTASRHAFVPTVSALDYRTTSYPSRSSLVAATFLNQDLGAPIDRNDTGRTRFDAFYVAGDKGDALAIGSENQPHLFVTDGIKAFVLEQLALPVPDRSLPQVGAWVGGPTQLARHQSGTWLADAVGGNGIYDYRWETWLTCDGASSSSTSQHSGEVPLAEQCNTWRHHSSFDGSSSFSRSVSYDASMTVRVTVTSGDMSATASHAVRIGNGHNPCTGTVCTEGGGDTLTEEGSAPVAASYASLPEHYALRAVAPNPLRRSATVRFDVPETAPVHLVVYDLLGRETLRLASGVREAGVHSVELDASRLPGGVYILRMQAGAFVATERFTVVE